MKVVSWNCNGALRNKLAVVDSLDADVLVIQECEDPAYSTRAYRDWAGDYLWCGESSSRGIGVFPKRGNQVSACNWHGLFAVAGLQGNSPTLQWRTDELRLFLPFRLNDQLTLLAVWTKGHRDEVFAYMGQFWKYLQIHRGDLPKSRCLILGDFNSNSIWDKSDRWWNHSDVVAELAELGFASQYHLQTGEPQGSESRPTFFLQRNPAKPYHIDYVFASRDLATGSELQIGGPDDWLEVSGHMPLMLDVRLNG